MLKPGATKLGLPKAGLQERARQTSLTSSTSTAMRTSRSSSMLASDQRLSKLKRANSDDALIKPALGAAASSSRMKKTVTTGAISDLAEARPRSLTASPNVYELEIIPPLLSGTRESNVSDSRTRRCVYVKATPPLS